MQFESDLHAGSWHFLVKACVDRRTEALNSIDCDSGYNKVELEFVLCANIDNPDEFAKCKNSNPEPEEDDEDEKEE